MESVSLMPMFRPAGLPWRRVLALGSPARCLAAAPPSAAAIPRLRRPPQRRDRARRRHTTQGGRGRRRSTSASYIGPDYCPELRVMNGAELMRQLRARPRGRRRTTSSGRPRSARRRANASMTSKAGSRLKIGVSGRVIAGPKGGAATVAVPLRIAVVKYQEAVLTTAGLLRSRSRSPRPARPSSPR